MTRSAITAIGVLLLACGQAGDTTAPEPPLTSLSLFPDRLAAIVGDPITLQVTARDTTGALVVNLVPAFSSSNSGVVAVQGDGRLTATGVGTATIRASAGGQTAETIVYVGAATYDLATQGPPYVLPFNYIDLSKIGRISRFRSTVGHSYTDGSETCRSMKHYYEPMATVDWTTVDIYARPPEPSSASRPTAGGIASA